MLRKANSRVEPMRRNFCNRGFRYIRSTDAMTNVSKRRITEQRLRELRHAIALISAGPR